MFTAIKKRRASSSARAVRQLELTLLRDQEAALAAVVMAASSDDGDGKEKRRSVERAAGKWRGSTLAGYLRGDDCTFLENVRCTKLRFDDLVQRLRHSYLDVAEERSDHLPRAGAARVKKAHQARDWPDLGFKVGACLYALGHGGPIKVLADVASLGASTLRKYLRLFADAVITHLKPTFMPLKPFSIEAREAVVGQFASRRGLKQVVLACDGSHVPFRPKNKKAAIEYRNFKGWTSILMVAFVDSYYRFFEVHVGYPGRAGDNTILARSKFMADLKSDPETWLGPGGVVLGDSGASDGDTVFLNPYHNPTEPDKCWFNFCHSSTRFFVEQVFGTWKSRFRFLLNTMPGANHTLATKLIYASTILHNYFIVHRGDAIEVDVHDASWTRFFDTFKEHRCPTCKRVNAAHCPHQATFRMNNMNVARERERPSEKRDAERARLWAEVLDGPNSSTTLAQMQERATTPFVEA